MNQTNMAPNEPYAYTSLPSSTSIRLLRRLGVGEDGLFEFSLEIVDLAARPKTSPYVHSEGLVKERPDYHCLSYTWGNPHADGTVFHEAFEAYAPQYSSSQLMDVRCNGKLLKVGRNLYDYFCEIPTDGWVRRIRDQPREGTQQTLLHDSAASAYPAIVHSHVGQGANVHAKDVDGRTPLHYAAANGQVENVKILIKGRADIFAKDNEGKTPVTLAWENRHLELIEVFKRCTEYGPQGVVDDIPDFENYGADDYIWIDAICIDQSNLQERAAQVAIMDRIYANAVYVLIWLGRADEYTDTALSTISKIVSSAKDFASSNIVPYRDMPREVYEESSVPHISQEDWNALASFFLRRWFRRIWVIQEAVFAQAAVLYCGSRLINWSDIETVVVALMQRARSLGYEPSSYYIPLNEVATCVEYHFRVIRILRRSRIRLEESPDEELGKPFSFNDLIGRIFPFRAMDPRDKIFALLPMSTLDPRRKFRILPDYSLPVERCYADFTKTLIREEQSLEALCYVQDKSLQKIANLPSWVPDFSVDGINPLEKRNFHASLDLIFRPHPQNTPWTEIELQGAKFDVISRAGNPRPLDGPNKKLELDDSWFDLILKMEGNECYQSRRQTLAEVLWRTLCADHDVNGHFPAPPEYGAMFKSFICAMVCSEPERQAREQENAREMAITVFGLAISAQLTHEENLAGIRGPDRRGPDEAAMARIREQFPPIDRSLRSKCLDCVRPTLSKLERLANGSAANCVPSLKEVENYFKQAIAPLREPNGTVMVPPQIGPYLHAHGMAYTRRRLFATKKGYLGLGPAALKVGDRVWIVPGSKAPLVLRPQDSTERGLKSLMRTMVKPSDRVRRFELVGETYIHGIMRGEAAAQLRGEDFKKFILV